MQSDRRENSRHSLKLIKEIISLKERIKQLEVQPEDGVDKNQIKELDAVREEIENLKE